MPKWDKWINDDNEEIVDDYEIVEKIRRKPKSIDLETVYNKKENVRQPNTNKE